VIRNDSRPNDEYSDYMQFKRKRFGEKMPEKPMGLEKKIADGDYRDHTPAPGFVVCGCTNGLKDGPPET